jgi:hypothetical protein
LSYFGYFKNGATFAEALDPAKQFRNHGPLRPFGEYHTKGGLDDVFFDFFFFVGEALELFFIFLKFANVMLSCLADSCFAAFGNFIPALVL